MNSVIKPFPKTEIIQQFVSKLHLSTVEGLKKNSNSIWELHNSYTNFCVTLLLHLTAHRPVIDPFCYSHDIDSANQLILINDKTVKAHAEYRLVALPELACQQYNEYLKYLEALLSKLRRMKGKSLILAHAIEPILTKENQYTPQFFYLNEDLEQTHSIRPTNIQKLLHNLTWFPDNMGRHILATSILESSNSADWATIQLGHLESCEHPFGITSERVPKLELSQIADTINKASTSFGWEVIKSPYRNTESKKKKPLRLKDTKKLKRVHKTKLLGPELRKKNQDQRFNRHKDVVRFALIPFEHIKKTDELTTDIFNSITEIIRSEAKLNKLSTNFCLLLFYKWLQINFFKGQWKSYYKRVFQIEKEFSPFNSDTLRNYQKILIARERFSKYLDESQKNDQIIDNAKRIAEIVISAGLFSYIASKMRLVDIIDAIYTRLYKFNDHIFVDLKCIDEEDNPDKNVFRWFPDTTTMGLIAGLDWSVKQPKDSQVMEEIKTLLTILIPGIQAKNSLNRFTKINYYALTIELPGYLVPVAVGKSNSVSIPLDSFIRVLSKKCLIPSEPPTAPLKSVPYPWSFRLKNSTNSASYKKARSFHSKLGGIFTEAKKMRGNDKRLTINKQKTKLSELTEHLMDNDNNWDLTCKFIGAWIIHICKNRTKYDYNLAFNSIYKYTNIISNGLTRFAYNESLLQLSDIEFEELYIHAGMLTPAGSRADAIGRFREFHHFLSQYWQVADPDWSTIYIEAECETSNHLADANFITEIEYRNIIESINRSVSLDKILKQQYIFLLALGYRFGLRFSEAYQLQFRDVQYDSVENTFSISIHNTRHGSIKSRSGIRKVSAVSLSSLDQIEHESINSLLKYFVTGFEIDHEIGLFSKSISDTELINKSQASIDLHHVIRQVTGDFSLRFHHLRHSWANRVYTNCDHFDLLIGNSTFRLTKHFVSDEYHFESNALSLKELSRVIGHASEETTIVNYLHSLDSILYEYSANITPKLSRKATAYSLNINHDTARQQISRNQGKLHLLPAFKKFQISITTPSIPLTEPDTKFTFEPKRRQSSSLTLLDINEALIELSKPNSDVVEKELLDECLVDDFIDKATNLEKKSGYRQFILYQKNSSEFTNDTQVFPTFNNQTEESRTRKILKNLQSVLDKMTIDENKLIDKFIDLWREGYEPEEDFTIVTSKSDITDFYNGCSLISNNKMLFNILTPPDAKPINLKGLKNVKKHTKPIKQAREKLQFYKQQRYAIKVKTGDSIYKTSKNFCRVLFCLALYKDLQTS